MISQRLRTMREPNRGTGTAERLDFQHRSVVINLARTDNGRTPC
jgi:hypothetical protein